MTDDLVKRLRFGVAIDEQGDVSWCSQEVMFNAADHIEKLEAALREIDAACDYSGSEDSCRDIARKALEGEDE